MKKICLAFFLLLIIQKAICQPWSPLGNDDQTSHSIVGTAASTFFTSLSADGVPYISYIDDAGGDNNLGDFEAHSKRYINDHWELAGDGISPAFPGSDYFPVALDGNIPYVAYSEAFTPVDIQNKLTVKRLNSNTSKWDVVGQKGISDGTATRTAIAADNGKIYVAYQDGAFDGKISVKSFDNSNPANGWQTVGTTGFSGGFVLGINIAIDNGIPYVAYLDFGNNLLTVKKFTGTVWEDVGTNNAADGMQVVPGVLLFNSSHIPYIAFVDNTGAGVMRNLNTANAWVTTGDHPFVTNAESVISMVILNDIPFVAFGLKENAITQIHIKRFNAAGNNWADVGNQPVTATTSSVNNVALITDKKNKLFVVYHDLNTGVYAKSFDAGSVLPVSLTAFYVSPQNDKSLLQWITAGEPDNKLFEVEHSTDAVNFKKIGEVSAKVAANIEQDYSFIHFVPASGINYYRLKQVDKNGNSSYSKIIDITFGQEQHSLLTVFPNPVKNVLHVVSSTEKKKEIVIRNVQGEIIRRLTTEAQSTDINVTNLPGGTYYVSLYGDTTAETKTFVK